MRDLYINTGWFFLGFSWVWAGLGFWTNNPELSSVCLVLQGACIFTGVTLILVGGNKRS